MASQVPFLYHTEMYTEMKMKPATPAMKNRCRSSKAPWSCQRSSGDGERSQRRRAAGSSKSGPAGSMMARPRCPAIHSPRDSACGVSRGHSAGMLVHQAAKKHNVLVKGRTGKYCKKDSRWSVQRGAPSTGSGVGVRCVCRLGGGPVGLTLVICFSLPVEPSICLCLIPCTRHPRLSLFKAD